ncbi:hypothetical protein HY488_00865 [Candidatus Woesearchaeota archaeon]|nr:hypothetical protein [Candidatus Woesearchaeota archaeon]
MDFFIQKVVQCEGCNKDFLYFGDSLREDIEEHYFCSPDCAENKR